MKCLNTFQDCLSGENYVHKIPGPNLNRGLIYLLHKSGTNTLKIWDVQKLFD